MAGRSVVGVSIVVDFRLTGSVPCYLENRRGKVAEFVGQQCPESEGRVALGMVVHGDRVGLMGVGEGVVWLTYAEVDELVADLEEVVADGRAGTMVDERWGWCVSCGRELVDVGGGFDTCVSCGKAD